MANLGRPFLRKVFPDHWSFLLGEIALYSFIILLLTGVFLTLWFKPSMAEVEYNGTYQLLRGLQMSEAYASTLRHLLRHPRRPAHPPDPPLGGDALRAAMLGAQLRIFFTGAFRKPREINWLIGVACYHGPVEGFAGYSLPDDLLSGTGLRSSTG